MKSLQLKFTAPGRGVNRWRRRSLTPMVVWSGEDIAATQRATELRLIGQPIVGAVLVLNAATALVVVLFGQTGTYVYRSPESAYLQHLDDHRVMLDDQTEYQLGKSVCADLEEGVANSEVVATIDAIPDVSTPEAEAIVYWSAADLCGQPPS